jgi:hypothetical protein
MSKTYKPGQPAPVSGQYGVVGPQGGKTPGEITAIKGKPLPPSPKAGQGYVIKDPTHNQSGDR